MNTNSYISRFLLGGYDLEMLTIRQMLEGTEGCIIEDKHLNWDNAWLSAYREELSQDANCNIYGIELREDIPLPSGYCRIDHHNDWADKPSSLEQVAEVLGVELTKYQQIVAANDKGYIPAMEALGASQEEINEIRRADRVAQGVTEEDEALAEKSIAENMSVYEGLTVVRAFSPRFSPICDRLFPYQRLLIYTDAEWLFYGEGTAKLVSVLAKEIQQGKVYYGGGVNGYVGIVQNACDKREIEQYVNIIIRQYEHK